MELAILFQQFPMHSHAVALGSDFVPSAPRHSPRVDRYTSGGVISSDPKIEISDSEIYLAFETPFCR